MPIENKRVEEERKSKKGERKLKTNRKYLLGLVALVIVAMLGIIGGVVFASPGEKNVSNTLTLGGNSRPAPVLTLAWLAVEGGTISGEDATVTWFVGTPYIVEVSETNGMNAASGIYGKLTGIDFTQLKVEFWDTALDPDQWTDLKVDAAGSKWCGFLVGTTYYFGPEGGDTLTPSQVKTFKFQVTPLVTVPSINLSLVDVTGVSDPR